MRNELLPALAGSFFLAISAAAAGPLSVADVGAPAVNCVFSHPVNGKCSVTVTDTVGTIALPQGVSGVARVQSRTYSGAAGTPGAGMTAYVYRVDLTQAINPIEEITACVTDLNIDFGPITKLPYAGGATKYDVFVITSGGIGSVGVLDATQTGSTVQIVFNQPVCAGQSPGSGMTSYFIGLASATAPHAVTAHVGWPGLNPIPVDARAPLAKFIKPGPPLKPRAH